MTIENITMPQLGESVTEGTISRWLVAVGDTVKKYDPIAEVMTDKVNAEIPSSFDGVIYEIVAKEDETLPVGATICKMTVSGATEGTISSHVQKVETIEKTRYSPAVLTLAQEHGIDLQKVSGTGLNGRITRKDVLAFVEKGPLSKEVQVVKLEPPVSQIPLTIGEEKRESLPVTPIRRSIAANMVRSKHEIPHAWMMVEVDVTNLVNHRNKMKESFAKEEGYPLTYFAYVVKAVAQTLKEFPLLNASWNKEQIVLHKDIHISIAVASENELFVPVIKHADEKSIKGIAREIYELAAKARTNTLKMDDISGGTFTVNNTGAFGSISSAGIINYPQAAILQVESIVKRPVVLNDMIGIRSMVNLCLSLDHRVLDGLICGRFLASLKKRLEESNYEGMSIY